MTTPSSKTTSSTNATFQDVGSAPKKGSPLENISDLVAALPDAKALARKCKSRLLVGEGNFTFTDALLEKHQEIARLSEAITATEYKKREALSNLGSEKVVKVEELGVKTFFRVDAKKLHTEFSGRRFRRIHFNCPHAGNDYKTRSTQQLVAGFFSSASKLQRCEDRIHLALALPKTQNVFRQTCCYGVVEAAEKAHYALIDIRKFDPKRYPGYVHEQTATAKSARAAGESFEFIFAKKRTGEPLRRDLIKSFTPQGWQKRAWENNYGVDMGDRDDVDYFSGEVSEGSSSYYDSEEDG